MLGAFDDPSLIAVDGNVEHVFAERELSWVHVDDGLPRVEGQPHALQGQVSGSNRPTTTMPARLVIPHCYSSSTPAFRWSARYILRYAGSRTAVISFKSLMVGP